MNALNLKITKDKSNHFVGREYTPKNTEYFDEKFYQVRRWLQANVPGHDRHSEAVLIAEKLKDEFSRDRHLYSKVFKKMGLWKPEKKEPDELAETFKHVYISSLKKYSQGKRSKAERQAEQRKFILMALQEKYPERRHLEAYVDQKLEPEITAYNKRVKRLSDKLFLNRFNYFVTITYDDKKYSSEVEFREHIIMTLAHFANRRGWRYCYCFENGDLNGRLHIHGFFYIPKNEMVGVIEVRKVFRYKDKKWQMLHVNTWFEQVFGLNEFSSLNRDLLTCSDVIKYCSDYCFKSGDKVHYSRYLPSELEESVEQDKIYLSYVNKVNEYLIDDDTIQFCNEEDVNPVFMTKRMIEAFKKHIKETDERLQDYLKQR